MRDRWLTKPRPVSVDVDLQSVRCKAESLMYEIDQVLQSPNRLSSIDRIKEKIRNMRQSGLERSGEFSTENLAFKILRRNGYLEKLYDTATRDFDDSLSVKQESLLRKYINMPVKLFHANIYKKFY